MTDREGARRPRPRFPPSGPGSSRTRPARSETRPYVGFTPTVPQKAAGWRTEPPVSLPSATGTQSVATATTEPPEEPPGTRVGSCGFRDVPKAEFSVEDPIANSSSSSSHDDRARCAGRAIAVASNGKYRARGAAIRRSWRPRTAMLSLTATGTPASGSRPLPQRRPGGRPRPLPPGRLLTKREERMQVLDLPGPLEGGLDGGRCGRRPRARPRPARSPCGGAGRHSITRGTRKKPSTKSARPSAAAPRPHSSTASARRG